MVDSPLPTVLFHGLSLVINDYLPDGSAVRIGARLMVSRATMKTINETPNGEPLQRFLATLKYIDLGEEPDLTMSFPECVSPPSGEEIFRYKIMRLLDLFKPAQLS